jgi:SAM-dependent methyltransferase
MRNLEWFERFDRIINWGNAFGYFDDAANRKVLTEAAAALKPNGRIAIDLINYLAVARKFEAPTVDERDGNILIDQRRLDLLTSTIVFDRTIIRDGRTRRIPYFLRMLTYTELRDWLSGAGFTNITGHSGNEDPLTVDSWRVIVIAQTAPSHEPEGADLTAG